MMTTIAPTAAERLRKAAEELGFVATWAPADLPVFAVARYRDWLAHHRNAQMGELLRGLEVRLDVVRRFGWVRSALVLAAPHGYPEPPCPDDEGVRIGRVGRVFWVREQSFVERIARPAIEALKQTFREAGYRARDWVDQGPLPLRSYAARSGFGWIGRNAMLITPQLGSYLTLAAILSDVEVEEPAAHTDRCGSCRRCQPACPTGALLGDGTLDARKCISYWTTQHPGLVPNEVWPALGSWIFGCDICQQVCPWNGKGAHFWRAYEPEAELAHPDLRRFFSAHAEAGAFERAFAGSAFERAGRTRMARNALIVLANTGERNHLATVRLGAIDPDPIVRATAAHALVRLSEHDLAARLLGDPDAVVAREARCALEDPREDRSFDQWQVLDESGSLLSGRSERVRQ